MGRDRLRGLYIMDSIVSTRSVQASRRSPRRRAYGRYAGSISPFLWESEDEDCGCGLSEGKGRARGGQGRE